MLGSAPSTISRTRRIASSEGGLFAVNQRSTSGDFGTRAPSGPRGAAEPATLLHHGRELAASLRRLRGIGDAHALHDPSLEMRIPAPQASATMQTQVHAGLAVTDERREVAALGRREGDPVLRALTHARIGGQDDLAHPPHRGLRRWLRPLEPPLDRRRLGHTLKISISSWPTGSFGLT